MKANMDLKNKVVRKVGHPVEIVVDPDRLRPEKSEVLRLVSDNGLARSVPGWEPEVSFEDGLEHTINRVSSNMDLYRTGSYEV